MARSSSLLTLLGGGQDVLGKERAARLLARADDVFE
jgi:hypothetical protein